MQSPPFKNDFFDFTRYQLQSFLIENNEPASHAVSIFKKVFKEFRPPSEADNISKTLKSILEKKISMSALEISCLQKSSVDSTVKFGFRLPDGNVIEAVLMCEKSRITLCLSSQVGCAQNCRFCRTARMGLTRNLTTGEIINEVYTVQQWLRANSSRLHPTKSKISNIVFMGMGEPLDNVGNVLHAIDILTDGNAFEIAPKRVSLSTAGHVDGLKIVYRLNPHVPIAFSIINPFNAERSKLMPINRIWSLEEVIEILGEIQKKSRKFIFIQYPMIQGYNDSIRHASKLSLVLGSLNARINLIPYNDIPKLGFHTASTDRIQLFRDLLHAQGYMVTVRKSNGRDIDAGCGQLARTLREQS